MADSGVRGCSQRGVIYPRTSRADLEKGIPIITRADGVRIFDQDGKAYLDLVSGWTRPVHIGYGRKEMAQAVADQILAMPYYTPMQFGNPRAVELAAVLAKLAPPPISNFLFVSSGSEAVETAIKLARHYHAFRGDHKRYKVISRRGAYHGVTGGALRVLGPVMPMRQIMEPLAPGTVFVESPYCYRCPLHLTYPACDLACARDVERVIEFEDPTQISAFIGEPVQQGFGAYAPPPEYWKIIRQVCDKYGILLIVDEVICGFGRTGEWFGIQHFGIQPDIMTMAKGISSGYVPLGAVGCTAEVLKPIDVFQHLHTYGNHPVSCAAGLKNIEILKKENLIGNAKAMGKYFLEGLKTLTGHPTVGEVRGTGLWTAIDFTADKKTRAPFSMERLNSMINRAKEKGLIIKLMGMALEFAPPLIIQKEEIDWAVKVLDQVITEEEKAMGL